MADNITSTDEDQITKKELRQERQKGIHILSVLLLAACLGVCCFILKAYFDGKFHSVESLQLYLKEFGVMGPVILTEFQAIQVVLPVLPGFLGCAAGAVMFGPAIGFLCNYIGISGGSIIAFFLAKKYGKPLLEDLFPNGKYEKWSVWASKSKSYTCFLFMAMVLPLFPDDYFCYLTGITKMTAKKFIWIIILGKPWCILAYSLGFSLIK